MEEEKKIEDHSEENSFIRIKKFKFIMLIFLLIFSTAGITLVALSFGDEKAVSVAIPERKEFSKLYEAYDMLDEKYFEKVDHKKLIDGAIAGMVKALDDPYSDYMTKEENDKFQESISASFQGIGAEIQEMNGDIVVVSPIKGSPAEKAGIKPNDKIITVDDKNIQGMSANEAVLLIRGEKGTKVTLSIQRPENSETIKMTITRDEIPINTVYAEMLDNGVAKIQITTFSKHTYDDLATAMKEMEDKGMKSLIIDLRRNPGGLLDQAIQIANLFVPEGKNIVQVEYRDGTIEKTAAQAGKKVDIPTVVLIDKGSASASEILAGAVSESAGIQLVGDKSFGKGTVQTANNFKDGSNVKYTMAKWLTPNGNWIHKKGIEPDVKVSLPEYANVSYIDPDKKYKVSSASNDVKSAEEMLKVLGYKPGKIDGFYDSDTEKAVKKFQKAEKLKVNGILTGETTVKLMNKLSEHIQKNDPQVKKAIEELTKNQ
ncbi:peptidoglycan-binding protein [Bacillus sp. FJAT-49732]|uniref:C-terminal processing peptidase n=1 Tax=Lederbergia citrisecunda TaxID=2833583 RepID=A0A942TP68_9BACI|nr:S41 family peptidase [Lederbergia citrisecunda]MBS4199424.1 peptidoglycan-binding protein [Lederbergia citrisecunda]